MKAGDTGGDAEKAERVAPFGLEKCTIVAASIGAQQLPIILSLQIKISQSLDVTGRPYSIDFFPVRLPIHFQCCCGAI